VQQCICKLTRQRARTEDRSGKSDDEQQQRVPSVSSSSPPRRQTLLWFHHSQRRRRRGRVLVPRPISKHDRLRHRNDCVERY